MNNTVHERDYVPAQTQLVGCLPQIGYYESTIIGSRFSEAPVCDLLRALATAWPR